MVSQSAAVFRFARLNDSVSRAAGNADRLNFLLCWREDGVGAGSSSCRRVNSPPLRVACLLYPSAAAAMPKYDPQSGKDPERYEPDYDYQRDEYRLYGRYVVCTRCLPQLQLPVPGPRDCSAARF